MKQQSISDSVKVFHLYYNPWYVKNISIQLDYLQLINFFKRSRNLEKVVIEAGHIEILSKLVMEKTFLQLMKFLNLGYRRKKVIVKIRSMFS